MGLMLFLLLAKLVMSGVEAWAYCGASSCGCDFAGAWRLCLHQRQDGLISELFSCILFSRVAVADYDGVRAAAAASAKQQIQEVRGYVSKFGQAQRAAESTLDMCVSCIRDQAFARNFAG